MNIVTTSGKLANEIKSIGDNFFSSDCINCFSHSRIFADGSRAELWSDSISLEHTYLRTNYTIITHAPNLYNPHEKYFFLNDKIEQFDRRVKQNYQVHLAEQRKLFNHDNTFIVRGDDDLCTGIPGELAKFKLSLVSRSKRNILTIPSSFLARNMTYN